MSSVPVQAPVVKSVAPVTEWNQQQPEPVASFVSETTPHVAEESLSNEEGEYIFSFCFFWISVVQPCLSICIFFYYLGESKSVYVRNLPTSVTSLEIFQEFKNFGRIKQDGVFLKNRKVVILIFFIIYFSYQMFFLV